MPLNLPFVVAGQTVAVGHVVGETATTDPRLTPTGHFDELSSRHAIGDVDALAFATFRAEIFAN